MRFFGSGVSRPEEICPFFFGRETTNVAARHCTGVEAWIAEQLRASTHSPAAMAQVLLYIYPKWRPLWGGDPLLDGGFIGNPFPWSYFAPGI